MSVILYCYKSVLKSFREDTVYLTMMADSPDLLVKSQRTFKFNICKERPFLKQIVGL